MGEMDLGSSGHCGWPDEAWPPLPGASLARPLPDSESRLGKATYCLGPLGPAWDVGHDHALAWLRTTVLSRGVGRGQVARHPHLCSQSPARLHPLSPHPCCGPCRVHLTLT